jgi:hypothetical protein
MRRRHQQANEGRAGFLRRLQGLWVYALVIAAVGAPFPASAGELAADGEQDAILSTVRAYLTAVYARDYAEAYRWLSAADRRLKSQADYEQDNEPFTGATLALAKRLAQAIVIDHPVVERQGERATVRATLSLPNGNAEAVSALLFAEGGSAGAPMQELGERMAKLEALIASGKLPKVEVEQAWELVRDPEGWRMFVDWASGVRIQFATQVPKGLPVTATFDRAEVLTPRGETVQLRLSVRNQGQEAVRLKVIHRVEPAALEKRLDLVQCGYLLPRDLAGGEADQSAVVYFVDEDLPKEVSHLRVILEFVALE